MEEQSMPANQELNQESPALEHSNLRDCKEYWDKMDYRKSSAMFSGLKKIDERMSLHNHEIMIIGARSGQAKTTFSLHLINQWLQAGKKVVYFSNEIAREAIWAKMAGAFYSIHYAEILDNNLPDGDRKMISDYFIDLKTKPLTIFDQGEGCSLVGIIDAVHKMKPDVFIIDHIQMVKDPTQKYFSRTEELKAVMEGIKTIVESNPMACVVVSQCNRNTDQRDFCLPHKSDLGESKSLEDYADYILLLSWPFKAEQHSNIFKQGAEPKFLIEEFFVELAKNRWKDDGYAKVYFIPEEGRFLNWEEGVEEMERRRTLARGERWDQK